MSDISLSFIYHETLIKLLGSADRIKQPEEYFDVNERRNNGAHYTTEENIMKVIRPLFLDDLRAEFEKCRRNRTKLLDFHKKLASLAFFDPACGCGNFLVLAYRELRLLEMDVLQAIHRKDTFDLVHLVQVDVDQFYGIEIVEFPVHIAETALWLMDHQMNVRSSERFGQYYVRLPLKKSAKIVHDNALRIDWNGVLPKEKCSYILGNPPFIGAKFQETEQKEDVKLIFDKTKNAGLLDYVACWYFKAIDYIQGMSIQVGFVSTNSIAQGEQVGVLWSELLKRGAKINFAYSNFVWSSEARGKAHVHCVIVGFGNESKPTKWIFDEENGKIAAHEARNINPYLIDAPDVLIVNRSKPLCNVPEMYFGNQPIDGGHFILEPEEKAELLRIHPDAKAFVRPFIGAYEFINSTERFCLWLNDVDPSLIRSLSEIKRRVDGVRKFRLASKRSVTRELAQTPTRFAFVSHPNSPYLLVPSVSSEKRRYIPMGFISPKTIASNATLILPNATLFHFGILTSVIHMDWMRHVCGRLESRYRYSAQIVYNNFPWPTGVSETNRKKVEEKAQAVLDARKQYPDSSLADMYDPVSMPAILVKAHRELDKAVDRCYRSKAFHREQERLEFLFERYEQLSQAE